MPAELDRSGVAQRGGNPKNYAERGEPWRGLFRGRIGEPEQRATALHFRSGLNGHARETIRKLPCAKLPAAGAGGNAAQDGVQIL